MVSCRGLFVTRCAWQGGYLHGLSAADSSSNRRHMCAAVGIELGACACLLMHAQNDARVAPACPDVCPAHRRCSRLPASLRHAWATCASRGPARRSCAGFTRRDSAELIGAAGGRVGLTRRGRSRRCGWIRGGCRRAGGVPVVAYSHAAASRGGRATYVAPLWSHAACYAITLGCEIYRCVAHYLSRVCARLPEGDVCAWPTVDMSFVVCALR